jgi:2-alkyl-3-oxoalkanoate reductase
LQAELAVSAAASEQLPCVILRPGVIFGGGIPLIGPAVARSVGKRRVVLGTGELTVPLVYIDDVVDAVIEAVQRGLVSGEVIQIIDGERLTQEEILALDSAREAVVRVPRPALLLIGRLSEYPLAKLGRQSPIGVYRLESALAPASFESDRAGQLLGWRPRVGVREGIRRVTQGPGLTAA